MRHKQTQLNLAIAKSSAFLALRHSVPSTASMQGKSDSTKILVGSPGFTKVTVEMKRPNLKERLLPHFFLGRGKQPHYIPRETVIVCEVVAV